MKVVFNILLIYYLLDFDLCNVRVNREFTYFYLNLISLFNYKNGHKHP